MESRVLGPRLEATTEATRGGPHDPFVVLVLRPRHGHGRQWLSRSGLG
jgi:hypothetical protein